MLASVRPFCSGSWAPLPTGFRDLGLSEGFNFGLSEGCYGIIRLAGVGGGLLGCSHERFPSIWGSWKGALSPSEALPPAGGGLWGPCLGASPERFPLIWVPRKPMKVGSRLASLAFRRVGPAAPTVHGALLVFWSARFSQCVLRWRCCRVLPESLPE